MNKYLARTLLFAGIIGAIMLAPPSGLTQRNTAGVVTTTIRQSEQLPALLPTITNTTNTASIPVRTLDTKSAAIVQFNAEFNDKTVDAAIAAIKQANKDRKKAIYLLLDSPGGDVDAGGRLIAAMGASKAPVYTVVIGRCASMCAITEEYGKERYMLDRTTLMFHPASMQVMIAGEVDKVISRLSYGKRTIDKMDLHTALRSGTTFEAFKAKTEQEYWTDAEDALRDHLIDGIVDIDFVKDAPPAEAFATSHILDIKPLVLNW